jgi:hypothetical protein
MTFSVSQTQPTNAALGDEWFNPTTNQLYKLVPANGTNVSWLEYSLPTVNPSVTVTLGGSATVISSNVYSNVYANVKVGYLLVGSGGGGG